MNENQMRSWRPRRPSATLKDFIFSGPAEPRPASMQWLWGGLMPTMACVLLTLVTMNRNGDNLGPSPMSGVILSNEYAGLDAADSARSAQNHLAAVTFEWTNHSGFNSSIGFTQFTNLSN